MLRMLRKCYVFKYIGLIYHWTKVHPLVCPRGSDPSDVKTFTLTNISSMSRCPTLHCEQLYGRLASGDDSTPYPHIPGGVPHLPRPSNPRRILHHVAHHHDRQQSVRLPPSGHPRGRGAVSADVPPSLPRLQVPHAPQPPVPGCQLPESGCPQ